MGLRHKWQVFLHVFGDDTLREFPVHLRLVSQSQVSRRTCRRQLADMAATDAAWGGVMHAMEPDEAERRRQHEAGLPGKVSFLIPAYNTRPAFLRALVDSLLNQTVDNWEACIYDGGSTSEETLAALRAEAARDPRIRVDFGTANDGISGNTNRALVMAEGDWVALADHDDLLAPDAVYRILEAAANGADFVYSDEDKVSEDGGTFFDPRLKPDFSPDTLRAGNYICHLMAMKTSLMQAVGGMRSACDGSQDHDLALRATEQASKVVHIPHVLYHWRMVQSSFSHSKARACAEAAARAVQDQCTRLRLPMTADCFMLSVRTRAVSPVPDWTLIVSGTGIKARMRAQKACHRAKARPAEIVYVPGSGRALHASLNEAARRAGHGLIVFLDPTVRVRRGWLEPLFRYAQRDDVACAGAALRRGYTKVRHHGYAVDVPACAVSCLNGISPDAAPPLGADRVNRNVTAVSRSLMMVRRDTFLALGGFGDFESDLASVSLGLEAMAQDMLCVSAWDAVSRSSAGCVLEGEPPAGDRERFVQRYGTHPEERYMHPLMRRDGSMQAEVRA